MLWQFGVWRNNNNVVITSLTQVTYNVSLHFSPTEFSTQGPANPKIYFCAIILHELKNVCLKTLKIRVGANLMYTKNINITAERSYFDIIFVFVPLSLTLVWFQVKRLKWTFVSRQPYSIITIIVAI